MRSLLREFHNTTTMLVAFALVLAVFASGCVFAHVSRTRAYSGVIDDIDAASEALGLGRAVARRIAQFGGRAAGVGTERAAYRNAI